jgi:hypothetical protein
MAEGGLSLRELPPLLFAALVPAIPIVHEAGILAVLPFALLVIPLLAGRYPGERTLERLRQIAPRPRPREALRPRVRPPAVRVSLLRNRLLIARSLAERAPPPLLASHS